MTRSDPNAASQPLPVIVVGGGISGLACAHRLKRAGVSVHLLDAANSPGGVISTIEENGFRFELGPQSFLATEPMLQLIRDLGLESELLQTDSRAPRYILFHGQLSRAPLSPPGLLTSPLLGSATKWRLFTEMFRHTQPPAEDESIATFVRRKFGAELLDHMVAPMVSGIYAGDPEQLSLRASFPKVYELESAYGSVLRGFIKSRPPKQSKGAAKPARPGLCSFRDGMDTLTRALAMSLGDSVVSNTKVAAIRNRRSGSDAGFELDVIRDSHCETLQAGTVIIASPTDAAREMLNTVSDKFAESFSQIQYAPMAVVGAGYQREQIPHSLKGFGFLVPRSEGLRLLGTVWNSSLFPGRAPEGMVTLTSFAGGATDPALCNLSADEIAEIVSAELARVLNISGPPVARIVHRMPHALPQYNLGHSNTVASLRSLAASVPGLFLTGNYLAGPALGTCVEQADQTGAEVFAYLDSIEMKRRGA